MSTKIETVGETIKRLRYEEGLTRKSLSILCGLSETFIEYIEYEKRFPSYRSLTKIADAVNRNMVIHYTTEKKITKVDFKFRELVRNKSFEDKLIEFEKRLYYDCLKMCNYNEANAADLKQDTLISAIESQHRFNESSQLYTWVYGIAKNIRQNNLRGGRNLTFIEDYIDTGEESVEIVQAKSIKKYIDELGKTDKLIYRMRILNIPHSKIASELGVSIGAVRNRYSGMKRRIKFRMSSQLVSLR